MMTNDAWDRSKQRAVTERELAKRSFCVLATGSAAQVPHAVGVLYQWANGRLYISTTRDSVKARNAAALGRAAVTVPVRRAPLIPPSCIQFQGTARVLDIDDPEILALLEAGALSRLTGHGELEIPGSCFIEVTPRNRLNTYGIGMSLLAFLRHPLEAGRWVDVGAVSTPALGAA